MDKKRIEKGICSTINPPTQPKLYEFLTSVDQKSTNFFIENLIARSQKLDSKNLGVCSTFNYENEYKRESGFTKDVYYLPIFTCIVDSKTPA